MNRLTISDFHFRFSTVKLKKEKKLLYEINQKAFGDESDQF